MGATETRIPGVSDGFRIREASLYVFKAMLLEHDAWDASAASPRLDAIWPIRRDLAALAATGL